MRQNDSVLVRIFKRAKITKHEQAHIDRLVSKMPSVTYDCGFGGGVVTPHIFKNSLSSAMEDTDTERRMRIAPKIRANKRRA